MGMADWYMPVPEAMIKTKAAAVKAIQLDETLVEAHVWLATLHFGLYLTIIIFFKSRKAPDSMT